MRAAHETVLERGMEAIRKEMRLPDAFPPEVEEAARRAAADPRLPDEDRTDLALVSVDPPDAMDLDQAMFVELVGDGYRVHYAIADVAAFVSPGDPIDLAANRRGETLYGADGKTPLHPNALSEDMASLLPGELRPALLWTIDLDAPGEGIRTEEHTSELQSLMRISYAVFCLK